MGDKSKIDTHRYGFGLRVGDRMRTFDGTSATVTGIERVTFSIVADEQTPNPYRVIMTKCTLEWPDGKMDWEWAGKKLRTN